VLIKNKNGFDTFTIIVTIVAACFSTILNLKDSTKAPPLPVLPPESNEDNLIKDKIAPQLPKAFKSQSEL
jgi:hypothetical protein